MRSLSFSLSVVLLFSVVTPVITSSAFAETGGTDVPADRAELYDSIVAEQRGAGLATDSTDGGGDNRINWVGFHPAERMSTVFIKTSRAAGYDVRHEPEQRQVVVDLPAVELGHSNFSRFLDTSHFGRGIDLVEVERTGQRGVRVVMTLESWEKPRITDTKEFIFIDLPFSQSQMHEAGQEVDATEEAQALASHEVETSAEQKTPAPVVDDEEEEFVAPDDEMEQKDTARAESPFDSLEGADDGPDADGVDDAEADAQMEVSTEVPRQHRWAIPLALGGLIVAGSGVGLHLLAERQREPITSVPHDEVIPMSQREAADIERSANRKDTAALGLFIAGGTATAIGITGWLLSSGDDSTTNTAISGGRGEFFFSWTRRY